ncbi:aspartate carbamoyltransferase catalytic subunit [candidate division WOR-3 bacterium]|uniref:Aspartate carbamoyltransferase n=1 Tax=candidate division WOR-3 bacterium TaxID=2052148 RepID=A0A9D5K7M2_UNCW3|nr:aspartate carbamoyltransferase catalytic subunit [candidate division WOR-3 bacterium]MBD3363811.1 aspartate carbamoyltransferase catalytic subunit [candidate division WOR-3 bacterium]
MTWKHENLLGLEGLTRDELTFILDTAERFHEVLDRPIPFVPALRGKTILNMFYEPSTRTSMSFAMAGKRLSADVVGFSKSTSAVKKGENLLDTVRTIESMRVDGVVIRHSCPGAAKFIAERIDAFVVNAGDGAHEHPTQGLLDLFSARKRLGNLDGKRMVIVGDITHSRVFRSAVFGFTALGAKVSVCGPPTLIPRELKTAYPFVDIETDFDAALEKTDIVMMLRMQLERQHKGLFPSIREYRKLYCLTAERLKKASRDVVVMHPGPMNRGVEIEPGVADGPNSVILKQVRAGVAVRMAVLYILAGGELER